MIRHFFAAFVLLAICGSPAFAQSFDERIRAIEQNNSTLGVRLLAVEAKIDGLAAKVDALKPKAETIALPSLPAVSAPVCNPMPSGYATGGGYWSTQGCSPQMTLQAYQPSMQASGSCGSSGGFFARIAERRAARRGW